jgi:hypothetical protein
LPQTLAEVQLPPDRVPRHDHVRAQRWAMLIQGIIATALTAAVVLMVVSFGSSMRELKPGSAHLAGAKLTKINQEEARQLLSLQLPSACWLDQQFPRIAASGAAEQQLAMALEKVEMACCTHCHTATKAIAPSLSVHQFATLQKSCLVCHKG